LSAISSISDVHISTTPLSYHIPPQSQILFYESSVRW